MRPWIDGNYSPRAQTDDAEGLDDYLSTQLREDLTEIQIELLAVGSDCGAYETVLADAIAGLSDLHRFSRFPHLASWTDEACGSERFSHRGYLDAAG